jgi:hypothetical protein
MKIKTSTATEPKTAALVAYAHMNITPVANTWFTVSKILSPDMFQECAIALQSLKAAFKVAEADYEEIAAPLKEATDKLKAKWNPIKDAYKSTEGLLKNLMTDFRAAERQKEIEAAEKAAKKVEKKAPQMAADIREFALVKPVAPPVAGIKYRTVWKAEVMEPELVPDEYWVIDEKKVAAMARVLKDTACIPGVRVYSEEVVSDYGAKDE